MKKLFTIKDLSAEISVSQTTARRHIKFFIEAGMVKEIKIGRKIFYDTIPEVVLDEKVEAFMHKKFLECRGVQ